jgi:hypothetical protein
MDKKKFGSRLKAWMRMNNMAAFFAVSGNEEGSEIVIHGDARLYAAALRRALDYPEMEKLIRRLLIHKDLGIPSRKKAQPASGGEP